MSTGNYLGIVRLSRYVSVCSPPVKVLYDGNGHEWGSSALMVETNPAVSYGKAPILG